MGIPLKVSDALFAVARQEAAATNRSITAQVEYWASIGRATEAVLAHDELLTLRTTGELLTPVFPSAARRREVHDLLTRVAAAADRGAGIRERIRTGNRPVYEGAPGRPGMIVQVSPDGTRRLGHLENRRFVPAEERGVHPQSK